MPLTTTTLQGSYVQLLLRGLLAGLVAGLLAGAVAFTLGEPHIDSAIAIEEAAGTAEHSHDAGDAAAGHSHDEEDALVGRDGQRAGLFLATGLAGLALGAIFATALYYARRFTALGGSTLAILAAALGWLAIEVVPFAKYPANPPAVGDPNTIGQRTWLWLATVILGLAAIAVGVYVAKIVSSQTSLAVRIAAPLAAFLVVVAVGYLVLPSVDEVGADFPAALLWDFRLSSLATQATLWLSLGLVFAYLTDRVTSTARARVPA